MDKWYPASGIAVPCFRNCGTRKLEWRCNLGRILQQKLQTILEQCGANGIIIVVDIVAVLVDIAVIVDIGGIILIVAERPQSPPAEEPIQSNPRITSRRTIIVFCRCSSKHRVSFDNRQSALKSARTVWEEYNLAP